MRLSPPHTGRVVLPPPPARAPCLLVLLHRALRVAQRVVHATHAQQQPHVRGVVLAAATEERGRDRQERHSAQQVSGREEARGSARAAASRAARPRPCPPGPRSASVHVAAHTHHARCIQSSAVLGWSRRVYTLASSSVVATMGWSRSALLYCFSASRSRPSW